MLDGTVLFVDCCKTVCLIEAKKVGTSLFLTSCVIGSSPRQATQVVFGTTSFIIVLSKNRNKFISSSGYFLLLLLFWGFSHVSVFEEYTHRRALRFPGHTSTLQRSRASRPFWLLYPYDPL